MPDTRLKDIAASIFTVTVADLTAAGITVPERRYYHVGQPAFDLEGVNCAEQFIVTWLALNQGSVDDPNQSPIKCAVPLFAIFTVNLIRCVPTLSSLGRSPTPAELQDSADELLTDAMTLVEVVVAAALEGSLVDVPCGEISIGDVAPYGPLGQVGGTVLPVQVSLV